MKPQPQNGQEFVRRFSKGDPHQKRSIDARLIEEAARRGQRIDIQQAIIRGPLDLTRITFKEPVCFFNCIFEDRARFSHSVFESDLNLSSSTFGGSCDLRRIIVRGDCRMKNARFSGAITFQDSHLLGVFYGNRARFDSRSTTRFSRVCFDKAAYFTGSVFRGEANFVDTQFLGYAEFQRSRFFGAANFLITHVRGQANFIAVKFLGETVFNGATFESTAVFRSDPSAPDGITIFEGALNFSTAAILGSVEFLGAVFKKTANFAAMRITQDALFGWPSDSYPATAFEGDADFTNLSVGGEARFHGATFREKANFSLARFRNGAYFSSINGERPIVTTFRRAADFGNARIDGLADFSGVVFGAETGLGDQAQGSEPDKLNFNSARITGNAFFRSIAPIAPELKALIASVRVTADFIGVTVDGYADFSGAKFFEKADFQLARFGSGVLFSSIAIENPIVTTFFKEADFTNARIEGIADFSGVSFASTLSELEDKPAPASADLVKTTRREKLSATSKKVSFNSATITGNAFFKPIVSSDGKKTVVATFGLDADFTAMTVDGLVMFSGAVFGQSASFYRAHFGNDAYFHSWGGNNSVVTTFMGNVEFTNASICGDAYFGGVRFDKDATFNSFHVVGNIDFRPVWAASALVTTFGGKADFTAAKFDSLADFSGATFGNKAVFDSMYVAGHAFFRDLPDTRDIPKRAPPLITTFSNAVNFIGADIRGHTNFQNTVFNDVAEFDYARFAQDVHFERTVLRHKFSFRETTFRTVLFSATGKVGNENQFQAALNFNGCTYDRIQVNWEHLLEEHLPDTFWTKISRRRRVAPRLEFDLQPYNQLEGALRTMGKDREADNVYLHRCNIERKEKWKCGRDIRRMGWVASALYGLFANYGVRPIRLAGISIALVVIGTFVFSQPGAVKPAKDDATKAAVADCGSETKGLSFGEATAVSIHQFLPVDIPLGTECKPARILVARYMRSDVYASILKVFGWILVPVGIAAITGILRRVSG